MSETSRVNLFRRRAMVTVLSDLACYLSRRFHGLNGLEWVMASCCDRFLLIRPFGG